VTVRERLQARLRALVTLRAAFWGMATAVVLAGVASVGSLRAQQATAEQNARLAAETQARADQGCVTSWATREDIRDAIEKGAEGHQKALLKAFAQFVRDQPTFAAFSDAYRQTLVDEFNKPGGAREQIPNPDCDLAAARRRLDQGENP
jgi:hypothetical protein